MKIQHLPSPLVNALHMKPGVSEILSPPIIVNNIGCYLSLSLFLSFYLFSTLSYLTLLVYHLLVPPFTHFSSVQSSPILFSQPHYLFTPLPLHSCPLPISSSLLYPYPLHCIILHKLPLLIHFTNYYYLAKESNKICRNRWLIKLYTKKRSTAHTHTHTRTHTHTNIPWINSFSFTQNQSYFCFRDSFLLHLSILPCLPLPFVHQSVILQTLQSFVR